MRKLVAEIHFSSPFSSDFQVKSISASQVKTLEVWAEKFIWKSLINVNKLIPPKSKLLNVKTKLIKGEKNSRSTNWFHFDLKVDFIPQSFWLENIPSWNSSIILTWKTFQVEMATQTSLEGLVLEASDFDMDFDPVSTFVHKL